MLLWRSGINDGTTQFWREIDCVIVETLMSESQGEKAHIVYKEEDGSHMSLAYELYFDMSVYIFSLFNCLAKIAGAV